MFEDVPVEGVLTAVGTHDFALPDTAAEFAMGADRIDALAALERVRRTTQAAMYEQIISLHDDRTAIDPDWQLRLGAPSFTAEVALALGVSTATADRMVAAAFTLRHMPATLATLATGQAGERTVAAVCDTLVSVSDEALLASVDRRIAPLLASLTPRRAQHRVKRMLLEADPQAAADRAAKARENGPRVFLEPMDDALAFLGVIGSAEQLTALHAELAGHATRQKAAGDPRRRGAIMVDTLVERGTGLAHADGPPVELQLLMRDTTVLGADDRACELVGYGPIDPTTAERLLGRAERTWWRRLYTDADGQLVGRDPRRRRFTAVDAGFLSSRDRYCRRPGCECRVAHLDHIRRHADGGDSIIANGQGLCARDNQLKEGRGWTVGIDPDTGGTIVWTTPTGHRYASAPDPIDPPDDLDPFADRDWYANTG